MSSLEYMNAPQRDAVTTTEGPLLILAGAGSGKTRVLTHRAAYLIEEKGVAPWNILAITFTNKAAQEMRERIDNIVGQGADQIHVSTFHSLCVRILRRYIDRMQYGYNSSFTIYDSDDQKTLMKDICKRMEIDTKIFKEKMFLNVISSAKDEMIGPIEFANRAVGDFAKRKQAEVYAEYQRALEKNNALDFDDLLFKTVELFKGDAEVLAYYQDRFRYIMVDEYQDTNSVQFEFVRLLAQKYKNLCVVGDDDQSIYKFRGANIYNILNFEKHFDQAKVIKLEQNYRSTQNILNAANKVIANNAGRKDKSLWTENDEGDQVVLEQLENAYEEADFVVRDIARRCRNGQYQFKDCAILYRTNAQSRILEEKFLSANVPYKIFGGVNFYSRKEVKDILAYLKTIDNGRDDVASGRILNIPKRGIGSTTEGKVKDFALANGMNFYEALEIADEIPGLKSAVTKIRTFTDLISSFRKAATEQKMTDLVETIIEETGYRAELEAEGTDEAEARIENIDELVSKAASYDEEHPEDGSLSGFLEEVALVADIDNYTADSNYVALMTLHSAKGLEFPNVYLTGMEDGLFPSYMSITSDEIDGNGANAEVEEERRLCYVGITRAQKNLTLTAARCRMVRGETQYCKLSRFVKEIPSELLKGSYSKEPELTPSRFRGSVGGSDWSSPDPFSQKPKPVRNYVVPNNQRNFSGKSTSDSKLDYAVGDRVRHIKFGAGTVTSIVEGGRDFEVTVDFDSAGTKKMFATFAKLKKC